MSFDADRLMRDRTELKEAIEKLSLPISIREPGEYSKLDTSTFHAKSASRELTVSVIADVNWGSDICSYVEDVDEFHPLMHLQMHVPNTLRGRVDQIAQAVAAWFGER
jgi:hypothetical protein